MLKKNRSEQDIIPLLFMFYFFLFFHSFNSDGTLYLSRDTMRTKNPLLCHLFAKERYGKRVHVFLQAISSILYWFLRFVCVCGLCFLFIMTYN